MESVSSSGASQAGGPGLRIVTIYDDFASGKRASDACDHVRRIAGNRVLNQTAWKYDMLRVSGLRSMATEEAADANVVILATFDKLEPSQEAKAWIEHWLKITRDQPRILVALIGQLGPDEEPEILKYLRSIAHTGKVRIFFLHARPARGDSVASDRSDDLDRMSDAIIGSLRSRPASRSGSDGVVAAPN